MKLGDNKKIAIIYGNCVTGMYSNILKRIDSFTDKYDLHYFPVPGLRKTEISEIEKGVIANADLLIFQRGHLQYAPFYDDLPSGCRVVSFPIFRLQSLWPLFRVDPRNKPAPESGYPFGKFPF